MRRLFKAVPFSKYQRLNSSYLSTLDKLGQAVEENLDLKEKVKNLQSKNKSLSTQLKKAKKD